MCPAALSAEFFETVSHTGDTARGPNLTSCPKLGLTMFPIMGNISVMKLSDYIAETGVSIDQFADDVGEVSISGVRKWLHGQRVPRPEQMRRIDEITGHRVMPNDFVFADTSASTESQP